VVNACCRSLIEVSFAVPRGPLAAAGCRLTLGQNGVYLCSPFLPSSLACGIEGYKAPLRNKPVRTTPALAARRFYNARRAGALRSPAWRGFEGSCGSNCRHADGGHSKRSETYTRRSAASRSASDRRGADRAAAGRSPRHQAGHDPAAAATTITRRAPTPTARAWSAVAPVRGLIYDRNGVVLAQNTAEPSCSSWCRKKSRAARRNAEAPGQADRAHRRYRHRALQGPRAASTPRYRAVPLRTTSERWKKSPSSRSGPLRIRWRRRHRAA
jgi:hypothetical protein